MRSPISRDSLADSGRISCDVFFSSLAWLELVYRGAACARPGAVLRSLKLAGVRWRLHSWPRNAGRFIYIVHVRRSTVVHVHRRGGVVVVDLRSQNYSTIGPRPAAGKEAGRAGRARILT